MANVLNKDPFTYEEDRRSFLQDLQRFHASRGTPFDRIPEIGGRQIDLYRLYRRVIDLGGWQKVNNELLWEDIQEEFKIPIACTNGCQALKYIYFRYLNIYEKVHFLGLDPDQSTDEQEDGPARKKVCLPVESIPLTYNYNQHRVIDSQRAVSRLSTNLTHFSDYEKLEMSLRSGLPNEVDFAFNICLLLSNESRHVLKLSKSLHLIPLLMANIGVFEEGYGSLSDIMLHSWNIGDSKRDFLRFWHNTVKDEQIREFIITKNGTYKKEEMLGSEVLHLGRELGVKDAEGQRITQLATLIRNLSFEEFNQQPLASSGLIFRFMMLCIHSNYGCLRQLALDTFGNLASQLVLDPVKGLTTRLTLNLIQNSLVEEDKFVIVRGLEILSKLCQLEKNEAIMNECVQEETYERIVQLLTVHDIQLIVHTLEAMYQLSELGDTTTTKIANVRHAVDVLVNLITVEAQSYGPESLVGIKVVEYVPPPDLSTPAASAGSMPPLSRTVIQSVAPSQSANFSVPSAPQFPTADQARVDVETTASNWLQATFEPKKGNSITQADMFADYQQFCRKFGVADLITVADFINIVKSAVPHTSVAEVDRGGGEKEPVVRGICRRAAPRPFAILAGSDRVFKPSACSVPANSLRGPGLASWFFPSDPSGTPPPMHTPTLRQRLMEPPRMTLQPPLVPPAGATGTGASRPPTPSRQLAATPKPSPGPGKKRLMPAAPPPAQPSGPGPGPALSVPSPLLRPATTLPVPQRPVFKTSVGSSPMSAFPQHMQGPQFANSGIQSAGGDNVMQPLSCPAPFGLKPLPNNTVVPVSVPLVVTAPVFSVPTGPLSSASSSSSCTTSPGQQFPLIHQALQGEGGVSAAKVSAMVSMAGDHGNESNLIKSLLAKKVCQNMVRHGGSSPSPQADGSDESSANTSLEEEQPEQVQHATGLAQSHQFLQQQPHVLHQQLQAQAPLPQPMVVQPLPTHLVQQPGLQTPQSQTLATVAQQTVQHSLALHGQSQPQTIHLQPQAQQGHLMTMHHHVPQLQQQGQQLNVPQMVAQQQQQPVVIQQQGHQQQLNSQTLLLQQQQQQQFHNQQLSAHALIMQQQLVQQQTAQAQMLQQPQLQLQQQQSAVSGQLHIQMQPPAQQMPPAGLMVQQQQMAHTVGQALVVHGSQTGVQTSQSIQTASVGQPHGIHGQPQQPVAQQANQLGQQQASMNHPQMIHAQQQQLQQVLTLPQGQVIMHRPQQQLGQQQIHIQPRVSASVQTGTPTALQIQPHQQIVLQSAQVHLRPQQQIILQQHPQHVMIQGQPHLLHSTQQLTFQPSQHLHIQGQGQLQIPGQGQPIRIQSAPAQQQMVIQLPMYQLSQGQVATVCATSLPTSLVQTSAIATTVMPFRTMIPSMLSTASNTSTMAPTIYRPDAAQQQQLAQSGESWAAGATSDSGSVGRLNSALYSALSATPQSEEVTVAQHPLRDSVPGGLPTIPAAPAVQTLFVQGLPGRVIPAMPTPASVLSPQPASSLPVSSLQRMPVVQPTSSLSTTQAILSSQAGSTPLPHAVLPYPSAQSHLQPQQHLVNNNGHFQNVNGKVPVSKECNGLEVNGLMESSDSDMIPSPLDGVRVTPDHLLNGLASEGGLNKMKECARTREGVAEKASKMNGVAWHYHKNGSVDSSVRMDMDDQRVPHPGDIVRTDSVESESDIKSDVYQVNGLNSFVEGLKERPSPASTPFLPHRDREHVFVQQASIEELSLDSIDSRAFVSSKTIGVEAGAGHPRPLFSPDSSRDSDLSCDSFASSAADSVSSDKHSTVSSFARPSSACSSTAPSPCPSSSSTTTSMSSSVFPDIPLVLAGTIPMSEAIDKKNKKKAAAAKAKAERPPPKNSKKKKSTEAGPTSAASSYSLEYMCEWLGCRRCFSSARLVFIHVTKVHVPPGPESVCQWQSCEPLRRKRWSLVTHLQDQHCSEAAQRSGCQRRAQQAQAPQQPPPSLQQAPALVYPPDAAMQAIKRFQIKKPYPELAEQREGPVTKHIRLTSALILRNLARYSPHGRSLIKHWERQLSYMTMSAVESSTALAHCLWEILHDT